MPSEIIETILVPENKIFIVPGYYRDYIATLYWEGAEVSEVLDETSTTGRREGWIKQKF